MNKLPVIFFFVFFVSCTSGTQKKKNIVSRENLKEITSPADSLSAEPCLFTDKTSRVYLSWIQKNDSISSLKFSVLNNSEEWSNPVVIASGSNWFVNWADYPIVTSEKGDSLMAHILEKNGKGTFAYDVKLTFSADSGKTWSKPKLLNDDGKQAEHGFVSMTPYNNNYFVSWLDGRNAAMESGKEQHAGHHGAMSLRAAVVDRQMKKITETELDNRVCDCCQTGSAITSAGPVVVYRDRSEDEIRDISIVRRLNNKWTEPKTIFDDQWKIDGCPVNGPRIAAINNSLAVAWFSSPEKKAQVKIIFSEDGGASFKEPVRIDEGRGLGRVDLLMLNEKTAVVSWMEGSTIKAVKVHDDGTKEPSIIIASTSEARSSGFPQMTASGNKIIFAWTDDKAKTIRTSILAL
jgi:hypothetical protein